MKTETIIEEYETEAEARGHIRRRATFAGLSTQPSVMKKATDQADKWKLPYTSLEVIEVTDRDGPDEHIDPKGNLDECLGDVEEMLLTKIESALGVKHGSIKYL